MDAPMLEATLKTHISELCQRLDEAAAIAKAAQACAEAGNLDKAIQIALDVEQLIYEATTLLNAASLMKRIYDD